MLQCALELEASASHVALLRRHFDAGFGGNQLSGFGCFLAIDQDFTGHDQRLSFLPGVGETAVYDQTIQSLSHGLRRLGHAAIAAFLPRPARRGCRRVSPHTMLITTSDKQ